MKFKLTLLSLFMAAALPALAQTPVYLDTNKSVEERVKDALTRMTLEEKVAMIHAQSKFSSPGVPRPVKELKAFQKVRLAPGEEKAVTLTIDKKALSFFDDAKHEWVVEPGRFEAIVGSSSRDIKGIVPFELK